MAWRESIFFRFCERDGVFCHTIYRLRNNLLLLGSAKDADDTLQRLDLFATQFGIAARDHDGGLGGSAVHFADQVARFFFGVLRHGAGIDQVHIGPVLPGNDFPSSRHKPAFVGRGLGVIELAAQGLKGNLHLTHPAYNQR